MTDKKRNVEVFTAGCPVCDPTVKMVKELACLSCDVKVHDLNKGYETDECWMEARTYNLKTVPAVVVDGKLVACCENPGPNREDLKAVGIGTPLVV